MKDVNVVRVHPNVQQVLVMKGRLIGSDGWDKDILGRSVAVQIVPGETGDDKKFVERQNEYGNHLVWVYGDYTAELGQLGTLMGLETEVVSSAQPFALEQSTARLYSALAKGIHMSIGKQKGRRSGTAPMRGIRISVTDDSCSDGSKVDAAWPSVCTVRRLAANRR